MGAEELLYEKAKDFDVLVPAVVELIKQERFVIKHGKLVEVKDSGLSPLMPWLFIPVADGRRCRRWSGIYFEMYGMISRNCFNCWKVVCRPKTLKELLKIRLVQKTLGLNAKCGLERRPASTHKGLYAAFWYAPLGGGVEVARELHKRIEREVHEELGFQTPVILKRACTEMEERIGPSDQWVFPKVQHNVEDYLDEVFEIAEPLSVLPEFLKVHILKEWIEYAWENRDSTVKECFRDAGRELGLVPTSTYEEGSATKPEQPAVSIEGVKGSGRPDFQGLSDYL